MWVCVRVHDRPISLFIQMALCHPAWCAGARYQLVGWGFPTCLRTAIYYYCAG